METLGKQLEQAQAAVADKKRMLDLGAFARLLLLRSPAPRAVYFLVADGERALWRCAVTQVLQDKVLSMQQQQKAALDKQQKVIT